MSQATGKVALVEQKMIRKDIPDVATGDTVKVHVKIKEGEKERLQVFEGTIIGFQNTGSRKSMIVRKISHGVGVERVFPFASPAVAKVEKLTDGRVRRSKIYYLRSRQGKAAVVLTESQS